MVLQQGTHVWALIPEEVPQSTATLRKNQQTKVVKYWDEGVIQRRGQSDNLWVVQVDKLLLQVPENEIIQVNPQDLPLDSDDLVHLLNPSEPHALEFLRKRYEKKNIYTFSGSMILAINPYQSLGAKMYDEQVFKSTYSAGGRLPAHLFSIAASAVFDLKTTGRDQGVVISGESGAGKTESMKYILKYLTASSRLQSSGSIENTLTVASPILESFGNAATTNNDNSSRFSRMVQIFFDPDREIIRGAHISSYLLEQSRITRTPLSERNYHIFYEICAEDKMLKPTDFSYLVSNSKTTRNDREASNELKLALTSAGFSTADITQIWKILLGILALGNIKFEPLNGPKEGCCISSKDALISASRGLEIDISDLDEGLVQKGFQASTARKSAYTLLLTPDKAEENRDAFAKLIYVRLFDWILQRINDKLKISGATNLKSIYIFDIFGFESVSVNSLEQLNINFANEALHQLFIDLIFQKEQQEYIREKIGWEMTQANHTSSALPLLTGKPSGMLFLLDEQCILPKGTDEAFYEKAKSVHSSKENFEIPRCAQNNEFMIRHFAGPVKYNISGFVQKNRNVVSPDLERLLSTSKNQFVAQNLTKRSGSSKTLSSQFRENLASIIGTLEKTNAHFVCCLRPNVRKQAGVWINQKMCEQLRYSGIVDSISIKKSGFPYRQPFGIFLDNFRELIKLQNLSYSDAKSGAHALLSKPDLALNSAHWCLGITMVFLKEPALRKLQDLTLKLREEERKRKEEEERKRKQEEERKRREEEQRRRQEEEERRRQEEEKRRKQEEERLRMQGQQTKVQIVEERQKRSETALASTLQSLALRKSASGNDSKGPIPVSAASLTKGKSRVQFAVQGEPSNRALANKPSVKKIIAPTLDLQKIRAADEKQLKIEEKERKERKDLAKKYADHFLDAISNPTPEIMAKRVCELASRSRYFSLIGDQIVFLNPHKEISKDSGLPKNFQTTGLREAPPSMAAYAGYVHNKMVQSQTSQCVMFKGFGGAGKTEMRKQFVSAFLRDKQFGATDLEDYASAVEWLVEQFTHYRTACSRNKTGEFPRVAHLEFDRLGHCVSLTMDSEYVESRVLMHNDPESRSFHIFYQVLAGLSASELANLTLRPNTTDYVFLQHSKLLKADREVYQITDSAFDAIGIKGEKKTDVLKILACILNLGNVRYRQKENEVVVEDISPVEKTAQLLGISVTSLGRSLTQKRIGGKVVSTLEIPFTLEEAEGFRDNLAMLLYEKLVAWIITTAQQVMTKSAKRARGVLKLDIFESPGPTAVSAGLKRLKRDTMASVMHRAYLQQTFEDVQGRLAREGVSAVERVVVPEECKQVAELLVDFRSGLLPLLTKHSRGDNDTVSFQAELVQQFGSKGPLISVTPERQTFAIRHFFGTTEYNYSTWIQQNRDATLSNYQVWLDDTTNPILKMFVSETKASNRKSVRSASGPILRTAVFTKFLTTFESQIPPGTLFVNCINSNKDPKATKPDVDFVAHQVRALSLHLAAAQGAWEPMPFAAFISRFALLDPKTWHGYHGRPKDAVLHLLQRFQLALGSDFHIGTSAVFLATHHRSFLEQMRQRHLHRATNRISAAWRGYVVRRANSLPRQLSKNTGGGVLSGPNSKYNANNTVTFNVADVSGPIKLVLQFYKRFLALKWIAALQLAVRTNQPWPKAPSLLRDAAQHIFQMFGAHHTLDMINRLSPEEEEQLRIKVTAYNLFHGKKTWNPSRPFIGEYFELYKKEKVKQREYLQSLLTQHRENLILFADYVNKVNKRGKSQYRAMIVTEKNIWKHDPKTYKAKKEATPLSAVQSLHMTPFNDTFVVVKCRPPHRDFIIDLGVRGIEKYSEFVGSIVDTLRQRNGRDVPVTFDHTIFYNNSRTAKDHGKDCTLTFQRDPSRNRDCQFKSNKTGGTVLYP